MTTQQSKPRWKVLPRNRNAKTGPNWGRVISLLAWLGFLGLFAAVGRTRVDPRVANPNVEGRPRPVGFLNGFDHWQLIPQIGALIMVVVLTIVFIRGWRRNPGSPVLLMVLCTTLIVWQDPIMNWSPYAVYNPMLLHWPESWSLIMMSPTVEPFIVFGYVTFYFGPYFPAIWILRKLQAKYGPDAFVSRHPLISLGASGAGDRLHLRRHSGDQLGAHRAVHLLTGDPVRNVVPRQHLPVPADLGVAVGDLRDDPGGHPRLPRRHGEVGGGEARREGQALPNEAGTRHVSGDVRHHQRVVLRLRRVVLGDQGQRVGHLGGLPVALPRGQGV